MTSLNGKAEHRDDDGAIAIEYALLTFLIAMAITAGAILLGGSLSAFLEGASQVIGGLL